MTDELHPKVKRELDRTAEMVVDHAFNGAIDQAIWLIYNRNRFDAASMKYLAERVQELTKIRHLSMDG